jgi:hypothetical protein
MSAFLDQQLTDPTVVAVPGVTPGMTHEAAEEIVPVVFDLREETRALLVAPRTAQSGEKVSGFIDRRRRGSAAMYYYRDLRRSVRDMLRRSDPTTRRLALPIRASYLVIRHACWQRPHV